MTVYIIIGLVLMALALATDLLWKGRLELPIVYLLGVLFWPVIVVSCVAQVVAPEWHEELLDSLRGRWL